METGNYSDQEIIDGIVELDSAIYQYLDKIYREKVIKHVRLNSGSREDGEEHYQDVIFEIHLNIKEGRYQSTSFLPYFNMINKRRWIDKLRKRKSAGNIALQGLELRETDKKAEQEVTTSMYSKLVLLINRYLQELSNEEQEYIRLYYYANKTLQFIADHFGISYKYAQQKLHRIRKKLRRLVQDDPDYQSLPNLITI